MKRYLFLLSWCLASTVMGENVTVLDFDAVPDGKTMTTGAIQKAIDHCSDTGGGTVRGAPQVARVIGIQTSRDEGVVDH